MTRSVSLFLALCLTATCSNAAEVVKIVSWNGEALLTVGKVDDRKEDLAKFGTEVKPDVLLLQEVTSLAIAEAVRDKMGLTGYHVVCSDFNTDAADFGALEVAIISKFPLTNVVEYDRSIDGKGPNGAGSEKKLDRVPVSGIADVGVGRGFLCAEITDKKLTLIVTHLKSSGGQSGGGDAGNAEKRELVAAAIVKVVAEKIGGDSAVTVLVAGDFNVGETDKGKNGVALSEDNTSGQGDRYDELTES
jgi:endonuclease/exonuclease/phosphatase family metal-dependent hydrolase